MIRVLPTLLILCLCALAPAYADRDIVYAARHYTPPGSHRTSHFHLYRINPDGTGRTQLTFGNGNEEEPQWTADGQHIRFWGTDAQGRSTLDEINAHGGRRRVLGTLPDNLVNKIPQVAYDFPNVARVKGYRLENGSDNDDPDTATHILINLKTKRWLRLTVPAHAALYDAILPMPGHDLMYAANEHESTVGIDYLFYRLDPDTGALHSITDGQFLVWSPNGKYFCTAPGRDTTPYEKRKHPYPVSADDTPDDRIWDEYRLVWTAPLYVRAATGGAMKQLTPDLSWVTGADWRHTRSR